MCIVKCALYNVHCTMCIVQCALYNVHCTMCIVQCAMYNVNCTIYILLYLGDKNNIEMPIKEQLIFQDILYQLYIEYRVILDYNLILSL